MKAKLRRTARTAVAALITLLVAAGIVAVTASPAAAAGCTGSFCIGHDPYAKGCAKGSSRTQYTYYRGVAVARVTNWYSPNCVSNWAEGALTTAGRNMGLGMYLMVYNDDFTEFMCYYNAESDLGSTTENCEAPYRSTVNAWTDMIDGSFEACARADVVDGNGLILVRAPTRQACQ